MAGDSEAIAWLATQYAGIAHHTALRFVDSVEAKDLAQDALIKVLTNLHRYNSDWKFSTWVITISRNTCIDWLRKQKRIAWSEVPDVASTLPLPDAQLCDSQMAQAVRDAVASLPPIYREVIEMHHFQDLKYREIASDLDLPIGTVMNRIFRARQKMKAAMEMQAA